MFQKKMTVQGLAALLLFSIAVSAMGWQTPAAAAGKERYRSSYIRFVKQKQRKTKKKLYYAITNASKDGMPVLLVTTSGAWMKSGKNAVQADVYSYSSKVVFIAKMQSTGSGYPLLQKGKYIISGWHHSSQRLTVSGAEGYMESVDGFGMESGKCHKESWTISNGKKKKYVKKTISEKKANALDYYSNAYENGAKEIVFHRVK